MKKTLYILLFSLCCVAFSYLISSFSHYSLTYMGVMVAFVLSFVILPFVMIAFVGTVGECYRYFFPRE